MGDNEAVVVKRGGQTEAIDLEKVHRMVEAACEDVAGVSEGREASGFGNTIKTALEEVNAAQQTSKDLRTAYEQGDNVPLTDVVIGMQKSSLAFEATLQIRNKVLKAYEEIMNMPV